MHEGLEFKQESEMKIAMWAAIAVMASACFGESQGKKEYNAFVAAAVADGLTRDSGDDRSFLQRCVDAAPEENIKAAWAPAATTPEEIKALDDRIAKDRANRAAYEAEERARNAELVAKSRVESAAAEAKWAAGVDGILSKYRAEAAAQDARNAAMDTAPRARPWWERKPRPGMFGYGWTGRGPCPGYPDTNLNTGMWFIPAIVQPDGKIVPGALQVRPDLSNVNPTNTPFGAAPTILVPPVLPLTQEYQPKPQQRVRGSFNSGY